MILKNVLFPEVIISAVIVHLGGLEFALGIQRNYSELLKEKAKNGE
jgi:hypothetical protein